MTATNSGSCVFSRSACHPRNLQAGECPREPCRTIRWSRRGQNVTVGARFLLVMVNTDADWSDPELDRKRFVHTIAEAARMSLAGEDGSDGLEEAARSSTTGRRLSIGGELHLHGMTGAMPRPSSARG